MDRIVALSASRWRAICKQLVCGLMSGFEARRLLLHISVSSPGWLSGYRLYLPLIERSWVRFRSATLSGHTVAVSAVRISLEIRLEGGIWPLRPEVCGILVVPPSGGAGS